MYRAIRMGFALTAACLPANTLALAASTSVVRDYHAYLGCWENYPPPFSAMEHQEEGAFSIAGCIEKCQTKGYLFAGLAGQNCQCGFTYDRWDPHHESDCFRICDTGDGKCGGDKRISVYSVQQGPADIYKGCFMHSTQSGQQALPKEAPTGQYGVNDCIFYCKSQGHPYAGLQGGTNCYCGADYSVFVQQPMDECDAVCTVGGGFCGGDNRISVYEAGGTPSPKGDTVEDSGGLSELPSRVPSGVPSNVPSSAPSGLPSRALSYIPTGAPAGLPSDCPSNRPTNTPTLCPSNNPSNRPTDAPSRHQSTGPSRFSTDDPAEFRIAPPPRGTNPCHPYEQVKKMESNCEIITLPTGLCGSCNFGEYDRRGIYNDCTKVIDLDNSPDVCFEKLNEYVLQNPCDEPRREAFFTYMNATEDTDSYTLELARMRLDFLVYAYCEAACDCIPQVGADRGIKQREYRRGNCQAHPYYDVCSQAPKLKLVRKEGSDNDTSGLPPICEVLAVWHDDNGGWEYMPITWISDEAQYFLERLTEATGIMEDNGLWDTCFDLEIAQGAIGDHYDVPGYAYLGCWETAETLEDAAMGYSGGKGYSIESCIALCRQNNYRFAGLGWGSECTCDDSYDRYKRHAEAECNQMCDFGDGICGGIKRISVYSAIEGPADIYKGCFRDYVNKVRALPVQAPIATGLYGVSDCIFYCKSQGYPYAGLEYHDQCFCGTDYDKFGYRNIVECNTKCHVGGGMCGGVSRLSVYETDGTPTTPSWIPSGVPSAPPTKVSAVPSVPPSTTPSANPSVNPSENPSESPSTPPSGAPSIYPSTTPSASPSTNPSEVPSTPPSGAPSIYPSAMPSVSPSKKSERPSTSPTRIPSSSPSTTPSVTPSKHPSAAPSIVPSETPSVLTDMPSVIPSGNPSPALSTPPTSAPSVAPFLLTSNPSTSPSAGPSVQPPGALGVVTGFVLVNAETGSDYSGLTDGMVLPTTFGLNIRAEVDNGDAVKSVKFEIDGQDVNTENVPPYALAGDDIDNGYYAWTIPNSGVHNITAIPYDGKNGVGNEGASSSVLVKIPEHASPIPSSLPSSDPSVAPHSNVPSATPSSPPSLPPSLEPSGAPYSDAPSAYPSGAPASQPTKLPSMPPSLPPSLEPSGAPYSDAPSAYPSGAPASQPTKQPSSLPSSSPSELLGAVTKFVLVNVDTFEDYGDLTEGMVLPKGNWTVRAELANEANVESVVFLVDSVRVRTENETPYLVAGDWDGVLFLWLIPPSGKHYLSAIPYDGDFGTGNPGTSLTVDFEVP